MAEARPTKIPAARSVMSGVVKCQQGTQQRYSNNIQGLWKKKQKKPNKTIIVDGKYTYENYN